jgi:murein DD-endopeptidase MepM/ murein hydrolase activator NlpD
MDLIRKLKSLDPVQFLGTRRVFGLFTMMCVFACLFVASGKAATDDKPGMGGTDRIGVGVIGQSENDTDIPADEPLCYTAYVVQPGDYLSTIAEKFNVTQDSIVSLNNITQGRFLRIGQIFKIPNRSGIMYKAKAGETVQEIAQKNSIAADSIIEANGLFSETVGEDKRLFLPDACLDFYYMKEVAGELFRRPVAGYKSSPWGWRNDPFSGVRSFHNGLDLAAATGTPVYAAMEGRIIDVGYSTILGNYIGISHHLGYQTFYGHLSKISVKTGQYVVMGQYIGNVGSTGYSTGSHLHFSVLKWGRSLDPRIVMR